MLEQPSQEPPPAEFQSSEETSEPSPGANQAQSSNPGKLLEVKHPGRLRIPVSMGHCGIPGPEPMLGAGRECRSPKLSAKEFVTALRFMRGTVCTACGVQLDL